MLQYTPAVAARCQQHKGCANTCMISPWARLQYASPALPVTSCCQIATDICAVSCGQPCQQALQALHLGFAPQALAEMLVWGSCGRSLLLTTAGLGTVRCVGPLCKLFCVGVCVRHCHSVLSERMHTVTLILSSVGQGARRPDQTSALSHIFGVCTM